jgi:poly(3-hydroxybutyrate) depolymerase
MILILSLFCLIVFINASELSRYTVSDITVSGISAGGYMAVQLHVTYSSIINGTAVFAGVREERFDQICLA